MDSLGPTDPCTTVVLCASSQSGKTEVLNNFVGFVVCQEPGPMLVIQPNTKPMGEAWSKERLAPMIRDTPAVNKKIATAKGRGETSNTIGHKAFPGGSLAMGGANSPSNLASRPIRFLAFDEIDRYELTKEGHAIPLATRRTQTFWNKKILKVSSPTYEETGILAELDECDIIHEWQLPCFKCGETQTPRMKHFVWTDRDIEHGHYECEHCGHEHAMSQEHSIKKRGRWVEIKSGRRRKVGFYINQFGSSLANWTETLAEFFESKDDPEKLQVFVNTVLAEPWTEPAEELDEKELLMRSEDYPAQVPEGALLLTAGVDVQEDRIEVYVIGWGDAEESWYIDGAVLYGQTDQAEVWSDLADFLGHDYDHETGAKVHISLTFIDSGFRSDYVYDFVSRQGRQVVAVKGVGGEKQPMIGATQGKQTGKRRRKVPVIPLGVDSIKSVIHQRLRIPTVGQGYVHIPAGHGMFSGEFVAQLTAEKRYTRKVRGYPVKEWRQTRPRNEALDCTVYAFAAMRQLNVNWTMLARKFIKPEPIPQQPAEYKRPARSKRQRGSYSSRW